MAGRPPDTTDREILAIFADSDEPILSTVEVSEVLSYSQGGTYKRLDALEDAGLLASKNLGNANAWWLTDAGRDFLQSDEDMISNWNGKET
ncbi:MULTISPECIES: winged helix-turn-helix transcriptional regulator [Halobacterium]|uniref:winged helix-turn-helix transcriptional regulator n=1 Tax=Halobacterium TaxID=2239 RepID=UPI0012FB581B|nr:MULTISPECIES: winged helix-turn-helix transcriptional regulator [Halobacterium]MCG1002852.1 winged helix-turn-helix transcriptional regulator [Halobacterium noricense]